MDGFARRKRLLVLSFFPCSDPPRSGGESRLYNLYRSLAERFEVLLLSTTDHPGPDGGLSERITYSPWFAEHRLARGPAYAAAFASARAVGGPADLSAVSVGAAGAYPSALHEAFLRHRAWADVIVHESPFTLPYDLTIGLDAIPRVYSSHNAEAALMRAMHPGARAAPIHALADASERALANLADLVMLCAEGDRAPMERTAGRILPRVHLAPNGASIPEGPPRVIRPRAARLLFVGSRHAPNIDAARFLIEHVAPALPGLELHVAGACQPPGAPCPGVTCHGEVSAQELARLVAGSDMALNPMRSGGGSNLKVLDWMAAGLPIVATPFGMRGAFAEPGVHYAAAELDGFADAVEKLADDADARERLSLAGAALVRERLTWDAVARGAGEALDGLKRRSRAPYVLHLAASDSGAAWAPEDGPAILLSVHDGDRIERASPEAGLTVIKVPRTARETVLRGLYAALRSGAGRIVLRSAALADIAASFGEPFEYRPDPAEAAAPMDAARAFCIRNAAVHEPREPPRPGRRLLIVTYRFTEPPLGGAEVLLRELLTRLDASGAWEIDVVCPEVGSIANEDRFACVYGLPDGLGAPPGLRRTRWRRFPLAGASSAVPAEQERAWDVQAAFDQAVAADPEMTEAAARGPRLLAGLYRLIGPPGRAFRWTGERATLHAGGGGRLSLNGDAPRPLDLVVTASGTVTSARVEGRFALEIEVPPGLVAIACEARRTGWPETGPAGVRLSRAALDGASLLESPTLAEESHLLPFDRRVALLDRASRASRWQAGTEITALRGPHSPELAAWVRAHAADYHVVLAQNCVFRPAIDALAAARAAGVPSAFLPHIHLDDDFYHFPDIARAFLDADVSLVSPRAARDALASWTGADIRYFAAGGVAPEEFSDALAASDTAAYRAILPDDGRPDLLVLGRKAGAKNYRAALEARRLLEARGVAARVVMIGPDDDGDPVDEPGAVYLGAQPREVVRGALRSAAVLLNMSASESFGIVLLEAWLGGCPVVANRGCGAFADLMQDGRQGFLVSGPAEAADRTALLLADPAAARRMAEAGRAVASGLSWDRQAAELHDVCVELADRRFSSSTARASSAFSSVSRSQAASIR